MKPSLSLSSTLHPLLLISPLTHALPKTHYSTITIFPFPLSSTTTQHHHHHHHYPTGTNTPGIYSHNHSNSNHNASANRTISLSYTLSYPTTTTRPPSSSIIPLPSFPPSANHSAIYHPSNDTTTPRGPPTVAPLPAAPCTSEGELYCHSRYFFSICGPPPAAAAAIKRGGEGAGAGGGEGEENRLVFMGEVPDGTVCEGGRIELVRGGEGPGQG